MKPDTWGHLWGLLCERFGKDASADLAATYLDMLEARLSDEEIREAVQTVLYDANTYRYWPGPSEIVKAANGNRDPEALAMEAWEKVMVMAKDWRSAEPREVLDDREYRALRQVGTVKNLAMMDTSDLTFRRKDFISAYKTDAGDDSGGGNGALPPPSSRAGQLIEGTADGLKLEDDEA